MALEVELKFLAETDEPLELLAAAPRLGLAELGTTLTFDETDRYLDTPDRRLAAQRWACRLRARGDTLLASLKGPPVAGPDGSDGDPGGPLHRRPEVEGPAASGLDPANWPGSPARSLLLELAGGGPLEERLRLVQRRSERAVLIGDEEVGTLSLDRVRVERGGREAGRLRMVELELRTEEWVAVLEAELRARAGLHPDPLTKLEHALRLLREPA